MTHRRPVAQRPAFPAAPPPLKKSHAPTPWPLDESEIELPRERPPTARAATHPAEDPFYLGTLDVIERGVEGLISCEVLLTVDGSALDIGPLHFSGDSLRRLLHIILTVRALVEP